MNFFRSLTKGDKGDDITEQLRDMFRVFVPACGNQETTVITPLLGTGNQVKDHFKFQSLHSKENFF